MIVVDASAIIAMHNETDPRAEAVAAVLDDVEQTLVSTPLVLAEVDHVLARRGGPQALEPLYEDLASGALEITWWEGAMRRTVDIARQAPRRIGLADASLVALAEHARTTRIATLDRDFAALKPLTGEPAFTLLPA